MTNTSYKHFLYDHELTLYSYAPLGLMHNQGEWPDPKYRLSIFTTASSENTNLVEWLTYHQAQGVNHIYLYCIDQDPTELYRQIIPFTFGPTPFVTFHHYRLTHLKTQIYFHFAHNYSHETLWHINLDINDYLYIHENHKLSEFIDNFTNTNINAVHFNIILCDHQETDKTILQQTNPIDYVCVDTKVMIRSRSCDYQYIFRHLNKLTISDMYKGELSKNTCNVLQQSMDGYYNNFPYNALKIVNSSINDQIFATAYIARLCNEQDKEKYLKNSLNLDTDDNSFVTNHNEQAPILLRHYTPEQHWKRILKTTWKHSFLPLSLQQLSIISNDKPCQQSSAPDNYKTEILACLLTKGKLQGITQSLTKKETDPWWEIDIEEVCIIKTIRLFNGIDLNINNMCNFIIESSEDHQSWIKRHQKTNLDLFGGVDGSYYNWTHPLGIKARWIRITVPGDNKVFSLDQIQILGTKYKNFYVP